MGYGSYKKFPKNRTRGRSRDSPSLCIEWFGGEYYINGYARRASINEALKYAYGKLPKVPAVYIYTRPHVVYMHVRKPSVHYTCVSEKLAPKYAWDLFVGHVGMLT